MTIEMFNEMRTAQKDCCKLCGRAFGLDRSIRIDHKHGTTHVRGLLCHRCNLGLGYFNDDPALLRLAAIYIETNAPLAHAKEDPRDFRRKFKAIVRRLQRQKVCLDDLGYSC